MRILSSERVGEFEDPAALPESGLPEVALLGRSNVGKSSLINRMAGRRRLAPVGARPGRTRRIVLYRIERRPQPVVLVDLPGYGYAQVPQRERRRWRRVVESYLAERRALRLALVLIDLRRDFAAEERDLLAWLDERGVAWLLVATKVDRMARGRRTGRLQALARAAASAAPARAGASVPAAAPAPDAPSACEGVIATSAATGIGVDELWRAIDARLGSATAG